MSDESGARTPQGGPSGIIWTLVPVLLVVAVVWAASPHIQNLGDPEVAVTEYEVTEGVEVFENVSTHGYSTRVTLTEDPSDLGISKAYIYYNGTAVQSKELDPQERQFGFPGTIHYNRTEIGLYDGSNRLVSKVSVIYGATEEA